MTFEEKVEMAKLNASLEIETKEDPLFDAINAVCGHISLCAIISRHGYVWVCEIECNRGGCFHVCIHLCLLCGSAIP